MQQVVFLRGVITSSILHVRCNNVWRITWEGGGVQYGFSKMAAGNVAWKRVFSSSQLFCLLEKQNFSSEIHVFRSDQFSFLVYRCLLPASAAVRMDYEENMENDRYAKNDDTPLWTKNWIILCCCIQSVTVIWIRHTLQASIPFTHRHVHVFY
jgi:hypothetical protein